MAPTAARPSHDVPLPVRKSSRVKKARGKSVKQENTVNEQEKCSICLDNLENMRSIAFLPCKHKFHRTCAIDWLESRQFVQLHTCPNCRQRVSQIRANERTEKNECLAFGGQQPTHAKVLALMSHSGGKMAELGIDGAEQWLAHLKKTNEDEIARVRADQRSAIDNMLPGPWVEDIEKELAKLSERTEAYNAINLGDPIPADVQVLNASHEEARAAYLTRWAELEARMASDRQAVEAIMRTQTSMLDRMAEWRRTYVDSREANALPTAGNEQGPSTRPPNDAASAPIDHSYVEMQSAHSQRPPPIEAIANSIDHDYTTMHADFNAVQARAAALVEQITAMRRRYETLTESVAALTEGDRQREYLRAVTPLPIEQPGDDVSMEANATRQTSAAGEQHLPEYSDNVPILDQSSSGYVL